MSHRILISTGVYPPKIGGPAQYSKNLKVAFEKAGHKVSIATFRSEDRLPTGIRHLFFCLKILPRLILSDFVIVMDTFSVALPTIFLSKIFGKKTIIRTGGDFLWENYVERTKKKVLFRNFYETDQNNFSLKEKVIFSLTKWVLRNTTHIVFSTNWQKDVFIKAYGLDEKRVSIIENYYGQKEENNDATNRQFLASTRNLVWKNLDILEKVFERIRKNNPATSLFSESLVFESLMDKMRKCYVVILVSFGDISPNMILDAIRLGKPFICTKEVGIYERIKDAGIFVDPLNEAEIERAVLDLLNEDKYKVAKEKVKNFNFTHTWDEIAKEFLDLSEKIK
jgi:glycosyltransferase involved in cell wall biosynthesis